MEIKKIKNQIIRKPLIPLVIKNIDAIAFHHMAHRSWNVKDVENYHVYTNGWDAIGYNYWIGFDGTIYEGRGLNKGAGVSNHNSHIISIGLQGDFESQYPTEEQYISAAELVNFLEEKIPTIKNIGCHRDWNATSCPGKNFDINKIMEYTKMEEEIKKLKEEISELREEIKSLKETEYNWTEACPEWSRPYIQKALDTGILKGDNTGQLRLTLKDIRQLVFLLRATKIMK